MSSKGQVVIPQSMRDGIEEGEEFIIIRDDSRIILKNIKNFEKNIKEDLEFAKRTEDAFERIEKGEYVSVDSDNLFKEMDKW